MRNAFAAEITDLAGKDDRIVLLSGDIGNRLFDNYKSLFLNRFLNCGVAEANMIGMASGMAMCGLRPVTYTIASFNTTRCLEQIRVDLCYPNLPVVLVGVGAGLAYAANGATHQACEDIGFLRILPSMTVICPGDAVEVKAAIREALKLPGPSYIRLGKKNEPVVHNQEPAFEIGKAISVRNGEDVCLLSTGTMLPVTIAAAERLETAGVSAQVVSFHTVKPLDEECLKEAFSRFRVVVTVEEHSVVGGFGSAVAEWLTAAAAVPAAPLLRIGTRDYFLHEAGGQEHARNHFGLNAESIATQTLKMLSKTRS